MIVDMRTYSYRPGRVAKALEKIALGLPERADLSPLAGLWQTESGRLHQIIHLWPYADVAEREHVRAQFKNLPNWPARTGEYMDSSETKLVKPAPFSPALTPRMAGPVYEIHTDIYLPGQLASILEVWGHALERDRPGSFVFAGHTELGPMNQWIHIWAHPNLEACATHRARLDDIATASGTRDVAAMFVKQESCICSPASFSPLK